MTAQVQEGLRFRGKEYGMAACPLDEAFDAGRPSPKFISPHTACWRGYVGGWEVRDDRLYLVDLSGHVESRSAGTFSDQVSLGDIFLDAPLGGVFAEWCTDWLRVPDGEMLNYIHMGFASEYERDLFLGVHRGQLLAVRTVDHRTGGETVELTPRLEEVFAGEAPFIRAALANPADRLPRLVYADWLDERDDARGELLRADANLAEHADDELRTKLLTARRQRVLEVVKDWFWMKLLGCALPTNQYGMELREW